MKAQNLSRRVLQGLLACLGLFQTACPRQETPLPPPKPLSERVTWEGRAPIAVATDSLSLEERAAAVDSPWKVHTFEFHAVDTLRLVLREYAQDFQAFRAFQEKASPEEIREGFYPIPEGLVFIHGAFLGELQFRSQGLVSASFLEERLVFEGEDLFLRPALFRAFPVAGQIPHSERVVSPEFLVSGLEGNTYLMRYLCGEDTATLYRGFTTSQDSLKVRMRGWKGLTETSKWSGEIRFSGLSDWERPRNFWIFKGGYLGVDGCYDPEAAQEYAEKMKKMTVILQEP